jgi:hypothetical protein
LVKRSARAYSKGETEDGLRFTLAFPYVYFVVVFDGEYFSFVELYFRNKPLTSVREHMYRAPLPNVWQDRGINNSVCMGKHDHFPSKANEDRTPARQAEAVVGTFWQRTFSGDLGTGGSEKLDKRIRNYAVWQQNTEEDPLFILGVNWENGRTAKGVVESILDKRRMDSPLDPVEDRVRKLLEQGTAKLTERVKAEIEAAKKTLGSGPSLESDAVAALGTVLTEHTARVFHQLERAQ